MPTYSVEHKLLFENEHFVAAVKPAGHLSTPSRFSRNDKRPVLGRRLEKQLKKRLYPLHRLDFEVSGLILYACNAKSHQKASLLFENRKVKKSYVALSEMPKTQQQLAENFKVDAQYLLKPEDIYENSQFDWECRLLRGKKRSYIHEKGKKAKTLARIVEKQANRILWKLEPYTGRAHQLRFELFRHGCPILGDQLYGSLLPYKENSIALKSTGLEFLTDELKALGLPNQLALPDEDCELN